MNKEIERLGREIQQKRRELDNCESVLKSIGTFCSAQQGVVTRLSQAANPNQNKIDKAKEELAIRAKDKESCSRNYYKLIEEIRQLNVELNRLQQEDSSDNRKTLRR